MRRDFIAYNDQERLPLDLFFPQETRAALSDLKKLSKYDHYDKK